jgi:hypothetical protein
MIDEAMIRHDYAMLRPSLNERGRRMFAAAQVRALGYGGVAAVARATGIAPIGRALKELTGGPRPSSLALCRTKQRASTGRIFTPAQPTHSLASSEGFLLRRLHSAAPKRQSRS